MADASILSTLEKHKQRLDALENELAAVKAKLAARPDPTPRATPAPKKPSVRRAAAPANPKAAPATDPKPAPAAAPKKKDFFDDF